MADILFVHSNFPAQLGFVAEAMRDAGHRCAAIASPTGREQPGIPLARWRAARGTTPGLFAPATRAEADLIRGRAALDAARHFAAQGFDPALIVGHPGWGETLFLRELFPKARILLYGEFYYRSHGLDVNFDPEFSAPDPERDLAVHAKNAGLALAYLEADRIVCPSEFQKQALPSPLHPRVSVIHEGVDTDRVRPLPDARFTLPDGRTLDAERPVVTFVSRRFEPLRGFHIMLRALPALMAAVPDVEILMIGADETGGYGPPPPDGKTWKEALLPEVAGRIDLGRVHFTGRVSPDALLRAMAIGRAHVYYTYPFVLSWSLFEAMAAGCLVVGSDTPPVREVVRHGENGVLADFFDADVLAEALIAACRRPEAFLPLREAARQTVLERFDRETICRPAWLRLVDEMLA